MFNTHFFIIKEFKQFLLNHGVYHNYINNVIKQNKTKNVFQYLKTKRPLSFIMASFSWDETNEGGDFWNKIHLLWIDIYYAKYEYP